MLKKIALFIVFAIAAIAFAILITFWLGKHELKKQQQAYLDAGGILDPALLAPPPIPNDENAALAYKPVFDFLHSLSEDEEFILSNGEDTTDPEFRALLVKAAPAIKALRAATDLPKCRWDGDDTVDFLDFTIAPLGDLRHAAILLKANILANTADTDRPAQTNDALIIRDIEAILRLSLHGAEDPTLIGQLNAMAVFRLGLELYEETFRDHPAPPNQISKILTQSDPRAGYRRALNSEVLMNHLTWQGIEQGDSNELDLPAWSASLFSWDRAYFFQAMQFAIAETENPYAEVDPLPEGPWYAITTNFLLPALGQSALAFAILELNIEMLKTAEQLRAHKQQHGSYPQPGIIAMPTDPVTGKPLQYEIIDNGFTLTGLIDHPDKDEITWMWEN